MSVDNQVIFALGYLKLLKNYDQFRQHFVKFTQKAFISFVLGLHFTGCKKIGTKAAVRENLVQEPVYF